MILLAVEVFSGVLMFYFDFLGKQIHLVFASLIFGLQFYILLNNFLTKKLPNDI